MNFREASLICSAVLALAPFGCGQNSSPPTTSAKTPPTEPVKKRAPKEPEPQPYVAKNFTGSMKGVVHFIGEPPKRSTIDTSGDKACHELHKDSPLLKEETAIVQDGRLRNVVVHLKSGANRFIYETPKEAAVIDQSDCRYEPHVLCVFAGQPILFKNSRNITHNVHPISPKKLQHEYGVSQAHDNNHQEKTFHVPELPVTIQCDVHRWMDAKIGVFDHPFFAVTGDNGAFEIKNVPPGEYEVEAWHETLNTRSAKVTVKDGVAEVNFEYRK